MRISYYFNNNIDNLEAWKYRLEIVNDNLMNKVTKPEIWYYELGIKKMKWWKVYEFIIFLHYFYLSL